MRDRLIEVLKNNSCSFYECPDDRCIDCEHYALFNDDVEKIADTILADGWMRPPLVMGDKVWIIDWCNEVNEYEVTHIRYNKDLNGQQYSYDAIMTGKNGADIGFYDSDIGKYVFLSREEAEKALKGKDEGK